MANIKLDKNVIVCFRFTVAGESRLLVVLQFSFFFAVRFSCEKRTLLLMLNFNNYCLSVGRFTRLFTAYSLIAVQENNKHTQSLKNVGPVGKLNWRALFLSRRVYLVHLFCTSSKPFLFYLLAFSQFEFCCSFSTKKKYPKRTVSMVMVRTVKSRPKTNQSEHSI